MGPGQAGRHGAGRAEDHRDRGAGEGEDTIQELEEQIQEPEPVISFSQRSERA